MRSIYLVSSLILISSFTLMAPKKKKEPLTPDHDKIMVYIPTQSFNYYELEVGAYANYDQNGVVISVNGFYMSPYEITNGEYKEYIYSLKLSGDTVAYKNALPDTLVWREPLAFNEPYVEYYFRHPAYDSYPLVGVTHEQSKKYCQWLTEKYNSKDNRKYKKVIFRLPTKHEWYAAAAMKSTDKEKKNGKNTGYSPELLFPWDGPYMRNKEGKVMANFRVVDEGSVYREYDSAMSIYGEKYLRMKYVVGGFSYESNHSWMYDNYDIVAPVKSYWPNNAGVYNLAGNVEEFVAEYGITKGGSWDDPGFYLRNIAIETYDSTEEATSKRGFRVVMDVVEE